MKTLNELLEAIETIKEHYESIKDGNQFFTGSNYVIDEISPSVVVEAANYFGKHYSEANGKLQFIPFYSHEYGFTICIWSTPCKVKTIFEEA